MGGLGLPKFLGMLLVLLGKVDIGMPPRAGSNRWGRRGDILWVSGRGLRVLVGVGCCAVSAGAAGLLLDGDGRQSEVKGGFGPCVSLVVVIGADRLPLRRSLSDPLITRKRDETTYLSFRDAG